jgi:hypothetical protein
MAQIDLPRPIDSYFAFAELASNRQGRRFTITFPYFEDQRLDRLQWWWQVSGAQERIGGEAGIEALRREAVDRFRLHIERWLETSQKRLFDGQPFPRLGAQVVAQAPAPEDVVPAAVDATEPAAAVVPWPLEKVANG